MIYTSNKQFDPIDDDVTELIVTPYLSLPTGGGGVEDNNGEQKQLKFKGDSLKKIKFDSFKVKIP